MTLPTRTDRPTSARERRGLAKLAARLAQWWNSIPVAARLPYYRIEVIANECRTPAPLLGDALRSLGWLRVQVRLDGICTAVWVAPGATSPLRAIGRPRSTPPLPIPQL